MRLAYLISMLIIAGTTVAADNVEISSGKGFVWFDDNGDITFISPRIQHLIKAIGEWVNNNKKMWNTLLEEKPFVGAKNSDFFTMINMKASLAFEIPSYDDFVDLYTQSPKPATYLLEYVKNKANRINRLYESSLPFSLEKKDKNKIKKLQQDSLTLIKKLEALEKEAESYYQHIQPLNTLKKEMQETPWYKLAKKYRLYQAIKQQEKLRDLLSEIDPSAVVI